MRAAILGSLVVAWGCGDVPIGTFPITGGSDGTGPSTGGDTGTAFPGGCVEAPFEGIESGQWTTWADADAMVTADDGRLTLLPATSGEAGTGLVLDIASAFDFSAARVVAEVITPPDPSSESELFLQVTQQSPPTGAVLSLALYQNAVRTTVAGDDGVREMTGPLAAAYPRWIGIRTADGVVYFETSDDGDRWTTLTSADQPAAFDGATPLVMVWNNATDATIDPQPVAVDNVSICAE